MSTNDKFLITIKIEPKFYMKTDRIAELLKGYLNELGLDVNCIGFDILEGEECLTIDYMYEKHSKDIIIRESERFLNKLLIEYEISEVS
ncbi:hypothetical protein [Clostridium disporicum]|uniref:hypothetical protein n=1 Tax=Clostridium disporicum TaxID=84024 RepID=UPI0034A2D810